MAILETVRPVTSTATIIRPPTPPTTVQNSGCAFGWSNTAGVDGGGLLGQSSVSITIVPEYTDSNCYWGINTSRKPDPPGGRETGLVFGLPIEAGRPPSNFIVMVPVWLLGRLLPGRARPKPFRAARGRYLFRSAVLLSRGRWELECY